MMDLTFFTIPRPFIGYWDPPQRNAVESWKRLDPDKVILCGQDEGVKEAAEELGCVHLRVQLHKKFRLPLFQSAFDRAQAEATSKLMCFVNADIILMDDFRAAVEMIADRFKAFLMIGRRWNLRVREPLDFSTDWQVRLRESVRREGSMAGRAALDIHVFNRGLYWPREVVRGVVGHCGMDLWLAQHIMGRAPVIDVTKAVTVIHQKHKLRSPRMKEPTDYNNEIVGDVSKGHTGYATWELTEDMKLVKRKKLPAGKWYPQWYRK